MELRIHLTLETLELTLVEDKKPLDSQAVSYERDLDQRLITGLDGLLKRNNVDITALQGYTLTSDMGLESTSFKIAQAFIEGLKAARLD